MLEVICSRCGARRTFSKLEDLSGAQFCDRCGEPSQLKISEFLRTISDSRADHVVEEQRIQKQTLETQIGRLQSSIDDGTKNLQQLKVELANLSRREDEIKRTITTRASELQSTEKRLEELNLHKHKIGKENEEFENQNLQLRKSIQDKTTRLQELEADIHGLGEQNQNITRMATEESKLVSLQANKKQISDQIEKLIKQRNSIETDNQQLQSITRDKTSRLQELEKRLAVTLKRQEEVERIVEDKKKGFNELDKRMSELRNEITLLETNRNQLNAVTEKTTREVKELEEKVKDLSKREDEFKRSRVSREKNLKSSENITQSLNGQIVNLRKEKQSLDAENERLRLAIKEGTKHSQDLDKSIGNKESNLNSIKQAIEKINREMEDRCNYQETTERQVKELTRQILEYQNAINELQDRRSKLEDTNSYLSKKNQDLEKSIQLREQQLSSDPGNQTRTAIKHEDLSSQKESNSIRIPDDAARREASSLEWLGIVSKQRQNYDKAERYFLEALEIRRMLGDNPEILFTLGLLFDLARQSKNYEKARDYGSKALEMYRQLGDVEGQRNVQEILDELSHLKKKAV